MASSYFPIFMLIIFILALQFVTGQGGCPARLTGVSDNFEIVENPACPDDNGKAVVLEDGTHLFIQCCTHESANAQGLKTIGRVKSRKDCASKCFSDQNPTCDSVMYNTKNGDCALYTLGSFSSKKCDANDDHDWLFFTDPPPQEVPMDVTHLCSTTCPGAHNQKYVSEYGKVFHMECGKRHGTMPFKEEKQSTYRDCVDGCAKIPKCSSVDWSTRSEMCYYLTHSGAAPLRAPGYHSAYSFGCTRACGPSGCASCKGDCGCGDLGERVEL
ncbi:hypothetical protein BDV25DRAFT_140398 [Aspergillus avenaceus]|uniref:Apple domain-containing protein n=1 Tax=Aspergillus avenaceus TaxID=36643 RepID=A0A5N6TUB2_ASPAV|nr:hypothetical protein BDV25DRAFT_140398 [Aspergillus avenaceus]